MTMAQADKAMSVGCPKCGGCDVDLLQPGEAPGTARLVMQNLSPLRQRLQWPSGWRCRRELDPELAAAAGSGDQLLQHQQLESDQLGPWQLGRWIVTAC